MIFMPPNGRGFLSLPKVSAILNSVRRFWARPSSVAFGAIGFSWPKPTAKTRFGSMPFETRYFLMVSAR